MLSANHVVSSGRHLEMLCWRFGLEFIGEKEPNQNITKLLTQQRITLSAEHVDKEPVPNEGLSIGLP
jgi:hypothetical protein